MSQQLLNPPAPPTLHESGCLLLASSGFDFFLCCQRVCE